jgi:hypothetical protein
MDKDYLLLKRAYDVLADGLVVGRIFKVSAAPAGMPWM